MTPLRRLCVILIGIAVISFGPQAFALGPTVMISRNTIGQPANGQSRDPAVSADGRCTVFASDATDLVPGGNGGHRQIYLWDGNAITMLSTNYLGQPANDDSDPTNSTNFEEEGPPRITPDCRFVVWASRANDFMEPGTHLSDTDSNSDIYCVDLQHPGIVVRVSTNRLGGDTDGANFRPDVSDNGRWVTFESNATNIDNKPTDGNYNVFIADVPNGVIHRVSHNRNGGPTNGDSFWSSVSGSGRFVAFESRSSNMIRGDDRLHGADIFMWDKKNGSILRVSHAHGGGDADGDSDTPSISEDGRWIAFTSTSTDIVRDDHNGLGDIFVWYKGTGAILKVTSDTTGGDANGASYQPSIASTGRFITFYSYASNLVPNDNNGFPDVFLWDKTNGSITRESTNTTGGDPDGNSFFSRIGVGSIDASSISLVFSSYADNLVPSDNNSQLDIFERSGP